VYLGFVQGKPQNQEVWGTEVGSWGKALVWVLGTKSPSEDEVFLLMCGILHALNFHVLEEKKCKTDSLAKGGGGHHPMAPLNEIHHCHHCTILVSQVSQSNISTNIVQFSLCYLLTTSVQNNISNKTMHD